MAECTLYTSLTVSTSFGGASNGNAAGLYLPAGVYEGYTYYTRTGATDSIPRIRVETNRWVIRSTVDTYGSMNTHATATYPAGQVPVCPVGLVYNSLGTPWGSGSQATITGVLAVVPEPTFGLPADVVALITSRFGTVANFLRLRNQGQV